MFTTAFNALVSVRTAGFRLIHRAGPDGFGPLLVGLTLIGIILWALSRLTQSST